MGSVLSQPAIFITLIGSFGGWIGSATVQHLTGLTLTQSLFSWFGPVGLIGSFGIYQTGLKAVLSPSRLRAFGWSRDQTPARGTAEALTTAATEHGQIHFGFPVNRQQTHIIPRFRLSDPRNNDIRDVLQRPANFSRRRAGGQWTEEGRWASNYTGGCDPASFPVMPVGANSYVEDIRISGEDLVTPGVYHANVSWLGHRKGAFITCAEEKRFNKDLLKSFFIVLFLSYIAMGATVYGQITVFGAVPKSEIRKSPTPLILYVALKFVTITVIHGRFLVQAWVHMPGKECVSSCVQDETTLVPSGNIRCHPARIRIYRQRYVGVGSGMSTSVAIYCERSYRLVQGLSHPALKCRVGESQSPFYRAGGRMVYKGESQRESHKAFKVWWWQTFLSILEFSLAILSLAFLFAYAYYIAWLGFYAMQASNLPIREKKLLGWTGFELALLAIKILLLAQRPFWPLKWLFEQLSKILTVTSPISHGTKADLTFASVPPVSPDLRAKRCPEDHKILYHNGEFLIKNDDMLRGRLTEVDTDHLIYHAANMKYKGREIFAIAHVDISPKRARHHGRRIVATEDVEYRSCGHAIDKQEPTGERFETKKIQCCNQQIPISATDKDIARIRISPFFIEMTYTGKIRFMLNTTEGVISFSINDSSESITEQASFDIAWDNIGNRVYMAHQSFNNRNTEPDFDVITQHFQRTMSFTLTTVKTQTGKRIDAIEGHTTLEPLFLRENDMCHWYQLNPLPRDGVEWTRNGIGYQTTMLGAGRVVGSMLSRNKTTNWIERPKCFCGLDTL